MSRPPSEARKQLLVMVLLVIAVGAIAIAIHHVAGLERASPATRLLFTAAWTAANLAIAATGLYRIRVARGAGGRRR